MNSNNAFKFGNNIGDFIRTEKVANSSRLRSFLRFQVQVNIYKNLKPRTVIMNDDGSQRWLPFKYERLSNFCFNCGKLGHVMVDCQSDLTPSHRVMDPHTAYVSWMRVGGNRNYGDWWSSETKQKS